MEKVEVLNVDLDDFTLEMAGIDPLERARCVLRAVVHLGAVSLYRTRGGYHICVRLAVPMDVGRSLFYRTYLGDDLGRVAIDRGALEEGDLRAFDRLFEGRVKGGVAFERVPVE